MLTTVIDCVDLDGEVAFFVDALGGLVHLVTPADDPAMVVVDVAGARVALHRSSSDRPARLVIAGESASHLVSPGGTEVEVTTGRREMHLPEIRPTYSVVGGGAGDFGTGRAGMAYRDLLPDRWGGMFVASHIMIPDGGDVADWVHFHRIRFQMIFVAAGWVDVVYEDQGPPFRMEAGDCVLQPPEIRHRVLRSSPGLEVIEIGCPAEHDTYADHDLALPTPAMLPERDFGGQRFVWHRAAEATLVPWVDPGLDASDTGIGAATGGLAGAVVVSSTSRGARSVELTHDSEFVMVVGLHGAAAIEVAGRDRVELSPRSAITLPAGERWRWAECSDDHAALVVSLAADAVRRC